MTYENLILEATDAILDNFVGTSFVPSVVSEDVITACNNEIILENKTRNSTGFTKHKQLTTLTTVQVARILLKLEEVKQIDTGTDEHNNDKLLLGVYQKSGKDRGTYITRNTELRALARSYKPSMTTKEFNEVVVCYMIQHRLLSVVKIKILLLLIMVFFIMIRKCWNHLHQIWYFCLNVLLIIIMRLRIL